MFWAIRLAKAGYFGGDPQNVLTARVSIVQGVIEYETFESDYQAEYLALNKQT